MLRTKVLRRIGRLLGAVAVTGALLTTAPAAAQAGSLSQLALTGGVGFSQYANSI